MVYVKDNKEFIHVQVETGSAGSSYTIIKSGLNGDETIALTEPPYSLIAPETEKKDTTKNQNLK